jgi:hypothetical protein
MRAEVKPQTELTTVTPFIVREQLTCAVSVVVLQHTHHLSVMQAATIAMMDDTKAPGK